LAEEISKKLGKSLFEGLRKKKNTKSQVGLPRKERMQNIKRSFYINNGARLDNSKVLIVDDVITTGATLSECARVLRGAGVREVWGATIAKE
jgi:predicted amidophosphoribosyltransferase